MFRYCFLHSNSSEEMALFSLIISKDDAWEIMNEIGKQSSLHFINLNKDVPLLKKRYAMAINRCHDLEKKVKFIEEMLKEYLIKFTTCKDIEEFNLILNAVQEDRKKPEETLLDEFAYELNDREDFLKDQSKKSGDLNEKFASLIKYKYILQKAQEVIKSSSGIQKVPAKEPLLDVAGTGFANISGIINTTECERFKKFIFRVSRGTL